ncbi:MAG TPA: hypothetical protein VIW69_08600, partial [Candidatus Elarobacter sp.]
MSPAAATIINFAINLLLVVCAVAALAFGRRDAESAQRISEKSAAAAEASANAARETVKLAAEANAISAQAL